MAETRTDRHQPSRAAKTGRSSWLGKLGAGVISGTANDDPSCIVTFSIAGAAFGYLTLWTSLYLLPVVGAVQLMSSRLGTVSGRGLAGTIRSVYSRRVLFPVCGALFLANVVTIGADLGAMAQVTEMITGVSGLIWTPIYAALVVGLLFLLSYRRIESVLRWLCLVLFAYVAAGLLARPDWQEVLVATFVPQAEWSARYLAVIVAILGATVSPYFLFWQAIQEVEDEYARGRKSVRQRRRATTVEGLDRSRLGVAAGAFVSKLITYAITLTTAATLFAHGRREIATAEDAAKTLEPIAGPAAAWLFALGVIGTGMLAVPVLACSSAYAVSEMRRWNASLEEPPKLAPKFYTVLLIATLLGVGLIYAGVPVVRMLFWASVLNGLLAPVAILLVVLLTRSREIMGEHVNPGWLTALGWASVAVTGAAAVAMLASFAIAPEATANP